MRNAKTAAGCSKSRYGKPAKNATLPRKKKNCGIDENPKKEKNILSEKGTDGRIRKVRPIMGLAVVDKTTPKLQVLNIVPVSYLKDIILSPGEQIHKVEIKSIGIIK